MIVLEQKSIYSDSQFCYFSTGCSTHLGSISPQPYSISLGISTPRNLGFHPRECIRLLCNLLLTLAQKTPRGFWLLLIHWDQELETGVKWNSWGAPRPLQIFQCQRRSSHGLHLSFKMSMNISLCKNSTRDCKDKTFEVFEYSPSNPLIRTLLSPQTFFQSVQG